MAFLMALCEVIPLIASAGLPWTHFAKIWCACALVLLCFECFAQFLALFSNTLLGMLNYVNFWFTSLLFEARTGRAVPFATLCRRPD